MVLHPSLVFTMPKDAVWGTSRYNRKTKNLKQKRRLASRRKTLASSLVKRALAAAVAKTRAECESEAAAERKSSAKALASVKWRLSLEEEDNRAAHAETLRVSRRFFVHH